MDIFVYIVVTAFLWLLFFVFFLLLFMLIRNILVDFFDR